jgi:N-terminal domain of NWD NACHT-NTPase
MELRSPEQVTSSPSPSASSVQQAATTVSDVLPPPPASPAPTASGATTSDTVPSTSSDLPERLWNRAYDELKAKEDKWVDAYERILSRELKGCDSSSTNLELQKNEIEQKSPIKRRQQMSQLVEAGLRKTAGEDKVKQVIGEAMQGVLNVKDMIGWALQPVPQAALAWTGVCFALQVPCYSKTTTMHTDLSEDTRKPHNGNESQSRRDRLCHYQDGLVL